MSSSTLQLIESTRLVAIIRLDDLSQAVQIATALAAGGITVQEFTLTNPDALRAAADVRRALADSGVERFAVGIGSVRNRQEAEAAVQSGTDFVVSPIVHPHVMEVCTSAGVPVMPGAYTPTEIATAWESGAAMVKVFPSRVLGPDYIKDVLAPMPYLKLMPTGGVDLKNIAAYFKAGARAVGIGGNLLDASAVARGDWAQVTAVARQYAEAAEAKPSA